MTLKKFALTSISIGIFTLTWGTLQQSVSSAAALFRVEVGSTDRILLERVRAVEPDAFVKAEENIIQVGLFGDRAKANRLVEALVRSGVAARVVSVARPQQLAASAAGGRLFRVEVSGTSDEILNRVRALEPGAFVRPGSTTIQAGLFGESARASQLVENLGLLGVAAQIVAVDRVAGAGGLPADPGGAVAPGTELTFVPLEPPTVARPIDVPSPGLQSAPLPAEAAIVPATIGTPNAAGTYVVVVPGRERGLAQLETRVRRGLNAPHLPVRLRNAPFGPHVAVGPFARIEDAQLWTIQLRLRGLAQARVERQGS